MGENIRNLTFSMLKWADDTGKSGDYAPNRRRLGLVARLVYRPVAQCPLADDIYADGLGRSRNISLSS